MQKESPAPSEIARNVSIWLGHIQALAGEIGPRGPATEGERRGSEYCAAQFRAAGCEPAAEIFPSAGSVFRPHLVAALGMLAAFALYPLLRWPAAALAVLVLVSEVLELGLRDNPLRWVLPRRTSRNVYALIEPAGPTTRDVIVIGHVDTQRTPIIFKSRGWLSAYSILSAAAFAAYIAQTALYLYGALSGCSWAWPASIVLLPFTLLLLALTIHAECTPFTAGANDNASSAGLVLTLAGICAKNPPASSRLWLVCTGSEESLHEGARQFFKRHKDGMKDPRTLNLEMLGCAGPAWLVREGIVTPLLPDPSLRRSAEDTARARPHLEAYPARLAGGVTEASDSMNAGVPAITIMGVARDGSVPHWHQPSDTPDKMRPEIMAKTYEFVLAMLEKMGV